MSTRRTVSPDLTGKVALITGGARGLGAATAWAICEAGGTAMLADLLGDRAKQTVGELRAAGHKADSVHLDVRSDADWANAVKATTDAFGTIDILVNNAGIAGTAATIEGLTIEDFQAIIDINLFGTFRGMQAVIPVMKAAGGGAIVNISSNSTLRVSAITTSYAASKAAVANLTKSAAIHLAKTKSGIRVNSVHPGPHSTEMLLGDGKADLPEVRALRDAIPMGRMGDAEEVGAVVAFLASDAASYVTGAELFVDGGLTPH